MANLHRPHRNALEEMLNGQTRHIQVPDVVNVDGHRYAISSVSVNNKRGCDSRHVAVFVPSRCRKVKQTVEVSMAVVIVRSGTKQRPRYVAIEIARSGRAYKTTANRAEFPAVITDSF